MIILDDHLCTFTKYCKESITTITWSVAETTSSNTLTSQANAAGISNPVTVSVNASYEPFYTVANLGANVIPGDYTFTMTATVTPSLLYSTYNFVVTVKDCPDITDFTLVSALTNPFIVYKSGSNPN